MNSVIQSVTQRIIKRSSKTRAAYLAAMKDNMRPGPRRKRGIITAYNDMLSAHQPFAAYPDVIKHAARKNGATAQVAGGVPAMCDGVTQGQSGMELSLLSRDTIAMSAAVGLSHDMFDAAIHLGVCDKIVPGLTIAALRFGYLPQIFAPAGPMPSGLSNPEKSKTRQLYAEGKVDRAALLEAESKSYHAPGTCTFYGTANSNQMLMEIMGLQLPGASFIPPNTPLRDAMTEQTTRRAVQISTMGERPTPICDIIDERAIVNGIVGLMATGGSTNLTIHLIAMARAAGIIINWDDFNDISAVVPLICRIYPNGPADVNHFQAAGGMPYLISELIGAGCVHADVTTVAGGDGLHVYTREPIINEHAEADAVLYRMGPSESADKNVLTTISNPFRPDGGLRLLAGNIGRGVMKVSAVKHENWFVQAPAIVIEDQHDLAAMHTAGALDRDFVLVLRFQGPRANGMPELHKLTPILGALQDKGFKVGLVTDGRMSGASGKIPAAIHMHPEAALGGAIAKVKTGDVIKVDPANGTCL